MCVGMMYKKEKARLCRVLSVTIYLIHWSIAVTATAYAAYSTSDFSQNAANNIVGSTPLFTLS